MKSKCSRLLTSSPPISKTASEEASMKLLRDLNPGNEVQPANQSNQEDGSLQYVEEILGQEDKCCK